MHTRANDIISTAKDLVGVPYKHLGRSRAGLDCAGLLIYLGHAYNLTDKDTTAYSRRPNAEEFTKFMIQFGCTQIRVNELEHGDILRINTGGWPVHLGIYEIDEYERSWYIHAYLPHRKVSRDPVTPEVWVHVSSVWRFPE